MHKWLPSLGIGAFVAICVATALLLTNFSSIDRTYAERAAKAARVYRDQANDQIRRCRALPVPQGQKCADDAYNAAEQEYRQEYNLAAQQTSAWWTKIAGFGAMIAGLIGLGSIALIFLTFRQTLKQASEIRDSVWHAGRSANAMENVAKSMAVNAEKIVESVEISRDLAAHQRLFGRMQMRPYISVLIGTGYYQDQNFIFEVRPKLTNSGHTPAENVRWRIAVDVLPVPPPDDFRFPLPKETVGGSILGPHQDGFMVAILGRRIPDEEVAAVKAGHGKAVYVWGAVQYRDVFNRKHWCTFAQQVYWEPTGGIQEDGTVPQAMRGFYLPSHNRSN